MCGFPQAMPRISDALAPGKLPVYKIGRYLRLEIRITELFDVTPARRTLHYLIILSTITGYVTAQEVNRESRGNGSTGKSVRHSQQQTQSILHRTSNYAQRNAQPIVPHCGLTLFIISPLREKHIVRVYQNVFDPTFTRKFENSNAIITNLYFCQEYTIIFITLHNFLSFQIYLEGKN